MTSEIIVHPIEALKAAAPSAHSVPERWLGQLSSTVASLGFATPVLVDGEGLIVAGHGRVEAARALGISEIPCLSTAGMSETDKHAYLLAHHKLAIEAGWDEQLLASELYGTHELFSWTAPRADGSPGRTLETLGIGGQGEPVTRAGDLWTLGPHRLFCGEAGDRAAYAALMGDGLAELVFADPLCQADKGVDASAAPDEGRDGKAAPSVLTSHLTSIFVQLARHSQPGAVQYIFSDWRRMRPVLDAGAAVFGELANLIVWVKDAEAAGGFCGSGHELVFAFENPEPAIVGQGTRPRRSYRRDVWKHAGETAVHIDESGDAVVLPTVRPVQLVAEAILDSTEPGAIVLDAFCGSATMLAAAHGTGRLGRALESDPLSCDRSIRRWQELTGGEAVLSDTGRSFADIERAAA